MRAVLGIDAAWTGTQPSGVALAVETEAGWLLKAVEASYQHFISRAAPGLTADARPSGCMPDAVSLLKACEAVIGNPVDLVAVDMPMAHSPITARRVADDAVSRAYGRRKCSTHTPSAIRPGAISDHLRSSFELLGYSLQTQEITSPCLIEVYPHPALVELTCAAERLPYKAGKVRIYWPMAPASERKLRLFAVWESIVEKLDQEVQGVRSAMPIPAAGVSGIALKAFEDKLDAVVCACVGISAIRGDAVPFGDEDAAIWIPRAGQRHGVH